MCICFSASDIMRENDINNMKTIENNTVVVVVTAFTVVAPGPNTMVVSIGVSVVPSGGITPGGRIVIGASVMSPSGKVV